MYRHRELLMSLLASAMLTTSFIPASEGVARASIIDPASANHLLSAAFSRLPGDSWAVPGEDAFASAMRVVPVTAVSFSNPADDKPIITRERIQFIHDRAQLNPKPGNISPSIAIPLGLSQQDSISAKMLSEKTTSGQHVFAAPTNHIGKVAIVLISDSVTIFYVCDMNGTLLSAGSVAGNKFTPMTLEAAAAGFVAEMRYWSTAEIQPPTPANNA